MSIGTSTLGVGAAAGHPAPESALEEGSSLRARVVLRTLRGPQPLRYYVFVPERVERSGKIVALIHGVSRNAREQALAFALRARRSGVTIVAPLFARESCRDYQQLGWTGNGWRADRLLDAVIDEVAADTGADANRFSLFGYSGGAQMAHRYALAHPARVARLAACAAGYYTMPHDAALFPYGLDCSALAAPDGERLHFNVDAFLRIPILAVVGNRDKQRDRKLRSGPEIDAAQGRHRKSRARRWVKELEAAALQRSIPGSFTYAGIPKAGHDFADCVRRGLLDLVWPWLTAPQDDTLPLRVDTSV